MKKNIIALRIYFIPVLNRGSIYKIKMEIYQDEKLMNVASWSMIILTCLLKFISA